MAKGVRRLPLLAVSALLAAALLAAPGQAAAEPLYGISSLQTPSADDFEGMGGAGADVVRLVVSWPGVQSSRDGGYRWDEFDALVDDASRNGVQVLFILYGTPDWAVECGELSSSECQRKPPLESEEARKGWEDFVREAVKRYGPKGSFWDPSVIPTPDTPDPGTPDPGLPVPEPPDQQPPAPASEPPPYNPVRVWQVWNEPSSPTFWKPYPDSSQYAELVRITSQAVKGVDSGATVILGGLFGTPFGGKDPNLVMWRYLDRLYGVKGTKRYFDGVSLHPYSPDLDGVDYQLRRARRVMGRYHDEQTGIWVTEIGWGSGDRAAGTLNKGLQGQKRMLGKAFSLLLAQESKWVIRAIVWLTLRDPSGPVEGCTSSFCGSSGLLDRDGNQKPAYGAYTGFTGGS